MITTNPGCRICGSQALQQFLSLGSMPLANAFLRADQLDGREPAFPLDVYLCESCSLVQLKYVVDPQLMFKEYVYFSSTSESFVAHFRAFAAEIFERFALEADSLVIDVGSNDGILLKPFQQLGARILGIDPAENVARLATQQGIETLPLFFGKQTAEEIRAKRGTAGIITANNVFAHVNDLDDFVSGISVLLGDGGAFILEVPYLGDLLAKNLFDTIYHEHLSYFSVKPLMLQFEKHAMEIFDIQHVTSHGGSLRIFVRRKTAASPPAPVVREMLRAEEELKIYSLDTWRRFAERIEQNKRELKNLLEGLKSENKTVAGYGAPAKGNTLLNYFGIGTREVAYIVDDSPFKQGLFTPGTRIPVVAPSRLVEHPPDYILILAWNFVESIMNKLAFFRNAGGKFIVPVPHVRIG